MAITKKKPPIKETVGSQFICFNIMDEDADWTQQYEPDVEQLKSNSKFGLTKSLCNL